MPLTIKRRGSNPIWQIRGTYRGVKFNWRSTGTTDKGIAEQIRRETENRLDREAVEEKRAEAFGTRRSSPITLKEAVAHLTATNRKPSIKQRLIDRLGDTPLAAINNAVLFQVASELHPDGTPGTHNRQVFTPIISIYRRMAKDDWVPYREWERPHEKKGTGYRPRQRRGGTSSASVEDMVGFLLALNPHAAQSHIVLYYTGMRPIELVYLPIKDICIDQHLIHIPSSKNGGARNIPIHPIILPILESWIALAKSLGNERVLMDNRGRNYTVPDTEVGEKREGGWFKTAVATARRRHHGTLDHISTYTTRKMFSSHCYAIAPDDKNIRDELMGHAKTGTNERFYIDVNMARKREIIEALPRLPLPDDTPWIVNPLHPWERGNRYLVDRRYQKGSRKAANNE